MKTVREIVYDITNRRKSLGITQQEIAEKMDTTQSAISRLESGKLDIKLSTLLTYLDIVNLKLEIKEKHGTS